MLSVGVSSPRGKKLNYISLRSEKETTIISLAEIFIHTAYIIIYFENVIHTIYQKLVQLTKYSFDVTSHSIIQFCSSI